MFLPLHTLLASGRGTGHPVCHNGQRFVSWQEFSGRVLVNSVNFAARPELRWLVAADNPLDFAILLLALLHAEKQIVIPPNSQPGTLAQVSKSFDAIAKIQVQHPAQVGLAPMTKIDPNSAVIDIYTSGSTGEPKRIRKTLTQFEAEVAVLESLWGGLLSQSCIVASAPHQHFYGLLFRLFWPLSAGRPFDTVTCTNPSILKERLALLGNTALISSPALLSRLPELAPLSSFQPAPRIIFSSGGPLLSAAAKEYHRQLGQAPTEVFGSTETGGIAWRRQEGDDTWTPMPGMQIRRDHDGALSLCSPYLLQSSPWRMDDAVELLPDGRFFLLGRLDRTVKIEERRLSLPDMEARLATHPWVTAVALVAVTGRRQSVGAVVILNEQGRQQLAVVGRREATLILRKHLAAFFEPVLLPRRWTFQDQLPINERGKLTHASLNAVFRNADD